MYLINGVSHYELQAARFLLEFSAREAEAKAKAKIVNLNEVRAARVTKQKPRSAPRTVPIIDQPAE